MWKISFRVGSLLAVLSLTACGQAELSYDLAEPVAIQHQVVITIDDFPAWRNGELNREEMSELFLTGFEKAPIPGPAAFALGTLLESTAHQTLLSDWATAGVFIGNHTFSHVDLHEVSLETYQDEITSTQTLLDQIVGTSTPTYFRHTYLHEGDTLEKLQSLNLWLETNDFRTVPVTVNFSDYLFEYAYERCLDARDLGSILQLQKLFLRTAGDHLGQAIGFANQLVARKVPHILLLHMSPFTARMFRELILTLKGLGVEFVSVTKALEDEIYQEPAELVDLGGMTFLERLLEIQNGPTTNELSDTLMATVNAFCPE